MRISVYLISDVQVISFIYFYQYAYRVLRIDKQRSVFGIGIKKMQYRQGLKNNGLCRYFTYEPLDFVKIVLETYKFKVNYFLSGV